jgi:Bacterial TSP3 repeat
MGTRPSQPLPADTDGDGVTDQDERRHRTDPTGRDSDFDGLSDDAEVRLGTDPLQWDSDFDGHGDGTEIALRTDSTWRDVHPRVQLIDGPHVPSADDPDGDGLPAHVEFMLATDMHDPDTDGDGLGDWVEMLRGSDPNNAYSNVINTTDLEAVERELPELRAAEGPKVAPEIIDEFGHRIEFPGETSSAASVLPDSFVDPGSEPTPNAFQSEWSAVNEDSSPGVDDGAVEVGSDSIDTDVSMA